MYEYRLLRPEEILEQMYRQQPPGFPPTFSPPNKIPQKPQPSSVGVKAIDPGAIRPCKYRLVYLWLKNNTSFWAFITYIGPKSISGFKWTRGRWIYFGTDLKNIESFECH